MKKDYTYLIKEVNGISPEVIKVTCLGITKLTYKLKFSEKTIYIEKEKFSEEAGVIDGYTIVEELGVVEINPE